MAKPKMTITNLRDELVETLEQLKSHEIGVKEALAINNTAGRIIQTSKIEMEYNKATGNPSKKINFLEG